MHCFAIGPTLIKSVDAADADTDADAAEDAEEHIAERLLLARFRFGCFNCAELLLLAVIVTSMDELKELEVDPDEPSPVALAKFVFTFSKLQISSSTNSASDSGLHPSN
jgi:hypothetical protein